MNSPFPHQQLNSKNVLNQKATSALYSKNQTNQNSNTKIEYYPTVTQTLTSHLSLSDFLRTSSECIPDNEYLIKYTGIPFGINLTPFPDIETSLIPQYSFGGGNGKELNENVYI